MSIRKDHYYLMPKISNHRHYQNGNSTVSMIIKALKMKLMSRSTQKQLKAIKIILKIIKSGTSSVTSELLIGADIPGLLCNVMNNHNPKLIINVYSCLLELSKDKEFYRQKHSIIVVETTCRTIKILATEGSNKYTIYKGIELLIKILARCEKEVTINLKQITGVVSDILKSSAYQGIHMAGISLLKTVMKLGDFDDENLPDLLYLTLTLLYKLNKNNVNKFSKHMKLALQIVTFSLGYFSRHHELPKAPKVYNLGWKLLTSFVVPSIKELDANKYELNIIMIMLRSISVVYDCLDEKKLNIFSNQLAAEGYLNLLPEIDHHFGNKYLHKLVKTILYHILARLAYSVLKWPVEKCQLIGKGLKMLPADSNQWPDYLSGADSEYVHLTVIVHLYFVLLCDCRDCFKNMNTQLAAVCTYLLSQNSPPTNTLFKPISFVFAVLSLSCPQSVSILQEELLFTTRRLVQWFKSSRMGKVFTHHPAMLYWFFSSTVIDRNLQVKALLLWMKDSSQASRQELKNLVLKSDEAAVRLLDVLNICSENFLMEVTSLLKEVIARDKIENKVCIGAQLWFNLPFTLSSLSTPGCKKRLKNVCCVIFMACKAVPHSLSVTVMLRLSQQLVQTLQNVCGSTWKETVSNTHDTCIQLLLAQLFKLAHIVVCKMNAANDQRGLRMCLEEDSLRRALLACLDSDNRIVTNPALSLLSYLHQAQKLNNIQISSKGTVMDGEFLLQLMCSGHADIAFHTANLFSHMQVLDTKCFISLSSDMSTVTIHALYLEFLNLSVRHDVVSSLSWRCATMLLQYCHRHNHEMEEQLVYFPLNHLALKVAFQKNGIGDSQLVEYLSTYMTAAQSHRLVSRRSYESAIAQDPPSVILTATALQLLSKEWSSDSIQSQLIQQICTIGGNIPVQTINALKLKIPRRPCKVNK